MKVHINKENAKEFFKFVKKRYVNRRRNLKNTQYTKDINNKSCSDIKKRRKVQQEKQEQQKQKEKIGENYKTYKRKGANEYKGIKSNIVCQFFCNLKLLPKSYSLLLVSMFVVAIFSITISVKAYNKINKEDYAVYNLDDEINIEDTAYVISSSVENEDVEESVSNDIETVKEVSKETNDENTSTTSTTKNTTQTSTVKELNFDKPINGSVLKGYSKDNVVYSETLELWVIHDGVDFAGSIGSSVFAMEGGTVEKIYDDSFLGITVIINHGQGYKSQYSNLEENVLVKENQSVKKGTAIGTIGSTAIGEIKDEPHVHIQIYKDDISINPMDKF